MLSSPRLKPTATSVSSLIQHESKLLPELRLRAPHQAEITFQLFAPKLGIRSISLTTVSKLFPLGGDPMILDRVKLSRLGPDDKITPAERRKRYETNSCMSCGKPGYQARHFNLDELRIRVFSLENKETSAPVDQGNDYTVTIVIVMVKRNSI